MRIPRLRFTTRQESAPPATAPGPESTTEEAKPPNASFSMRTLMLIVATCGLAAWAALAVRDTYFPVHRLARRIEHGSPEERKEAIAELVALSGRELLNALPALTGALADEDEQVAVTAGRAIGAALVSALQRNDPVAARAAVAALLMALKDRRPRVRTEAAVALSTAAGLNTLGRDTRTACLEAFGTALSDQSDEVRAGVVTALGLFEGANPRTPPDGLLAALKGDSSARVRGAAVKALAPYVRSDDPEALELFRALKAALDADPATSVRVTAAQSLGPLQWSNNQVVLALLHALEANEQVVSDMADRMLSFPPPKSVAASPKRDPALVPAMIEALANRNRRVRFHGAAALGEIGFDSEAAVPALIKLLEDPIEPETRRVWCGHLHHDPAAEAATSLGRIAPATPYATDVVAALTEVIRTTKDDQRGATAAGALTHFGLGLTKPTVPVLLEALHDRLGTNGFQAAWLSFAVGRIAPTTPLADEAVAVLSAALDGPTEDTRLQAAEALGLFGARAKPALGRLREVAKSDKAPFVRPFAEKSVDQIERALKDAQSQQVPAAK